MKVTYRGNKIQKQKSIGTAVLLGADSNVKTNIAPYPEGNRRSAKY